MDEETEMLKRTFRNHFGLDPNELEIENLREQWKIRQADNALNNMWTITLTESSADMTGDPAIGDAA